MELRESNSEDTDRIREVVESSMTSSFRLSPQQIENITGSEFGDERMTEAFRNDDSVFLVSEAETGDGSDAVVGFFWGTAADGRGDVRWLFVDPEHRGEGVGTRLLETGIEQLRDADASQVRAYALQASLDGHQFCEQFGFEQTDERQVDVGDETLAQFVYTLADSDAMSDDTSASEPPE